MKKVIITAAALAALASTAFAADLPARMPARVEAPPAPVMSWSGCYVGAGGGYSMWNQDHTTVNSAGIPVTPGLSATTGGRGYFATAQVGCDYQFDQRWLVGVFGDGNWGGFKGDYQDNAFALWGHEKEKWSWAAGGRVGYLLYPQLLTFASAGYTSARFDQINLTNGAAITNILAQHTYSGWFLGTGYEYQISWLPGLTWKTEYRFADYGKDNLPLLTAAGAATGFSTNSHKYEQTIRSELVWRFNLWR